MFEKNPILRMLCVLFFIAWILVSLGAGGIDLSMVIPVAMILVILKDKITTSPKILRISGILVLMGFVSLVVFDMFKGDNLAFTFLFAIAFCLFFAPFILAIFFAFFGTKVVDQISPALSPVSNGENDTVSHKSPRKLIGVVVALLLFLLLLIITYYWSSII